MLSCVSSPTFWDENPDRRFRQLTESACQLPLGSITLSAISYQSNSFLRIFYFLFTVSLSAFTARVDYFISNLFGRQTVFRIFLIFFLTVSLSVRTAKGEKDYQTGFNVQGFFKFFSGRFEIAFPPLFTGLFQSPFKQIVFIQAKKMAELVQKSGADLLTIDLRVILREIPQVGEEENDLRGHDNVSLFGEL